MKKIIAMLLVLAMCLALTACDSGDYKKATELYDSGSYEKARTIFMKLEDYEDSAEMVKACDYATAKNLFESGEYESAGSAFTELGDYKDSTTYALKSDYRMAETLLNSGDYESAIAIFTKISDFEDAALMRRTAEQELMHELYGDVLDALEGNTWYFNGGSDTVLRKR